MEYPKQIMKLSELKNMGFPVPLLMEAYRDPKQTFATKIDPAKPNSTIIFDTVGFDKWITKRINIRVCKSKTKACKRYRMEDSKRGRINVKKIQGLDG